MIKIYYIIEPVKPSFYHAAVDADLTGGLLDLSGYFDTEQDAINAIDEQCSRAGLLPRMEFIVSKKIVYIRSFS